MATMAYQNYQPAQSQQQQQQQQQQMMQQQMMQQAQQQRQAQQQQQQQIQAYNPNPHAARAAPPARPPDAPLSRCWGAEFKVRLN